MDEPHGRVVLYSGHEQRCLYGLCKIVFGAVLGFCLGFCNHLFGQLGIGTDDGVLCLAGQLDGVGVVVIPLLAATQQQVCRQSCPQKEEECFSHIVSFLESCVLLSVRKNTFFFQGTDKYRINRLYWCIRYEIN